MPKFGMQAGKFVQIFYLHDHWAVGINMFSSSSHVIYWYDSRPKSFVRQEVIVQLSSLLRADTEEQTMKLHIRNCDHQPDNTNLCGHYAIGFTLAICGGVDPTLLRFDVNGLVNMVNSGLR